MTSSSITRFPSTPFTSPVSASGTDTRISFSVDGGQSFAAAGISSRSPRLTAARGSQGHPSTPRSAGNTLKPLQPGQSIIRRVPGGPAVSRRQHTRNHAMHSMSSRSAHTCPCSCRSRRLPRSTGPPAGPACAATVPLPPHSSNRNETFCYTRKEYCNEVI